MVQVTALAFSPDGGQLSSADEDGVIMTWDLAEANKLASAAKHAGAVWSLAYSQGDGGLLASGTIRTFEHAARFMADVLSQSGRVIGDEIQGIWATGNNAVDIVSC